MSSVENFEICTIFLFFQNQWSHLNTIENNIKNILAKIVMNKTKWEDFIHECDDGGVNCEVIVLTECDSFQGYGVYILCVEIHLDFDYRLLGSRGGELTLYWGIQGCYEKLAHILRKSL